MIIEYRNLKADEISIELFGQFNRYQKVTKCWRKENVAWLLENASFIDDWNEDDIAYLVQCLKQKKKTGGAVCGAFENETLVGMLFYGL